jgi:hypothetical protein
MVRVSAETPVLIVDEDSESPTREDPSFESSPADGPGDSGGHYEPWLPSGSAERSNRYRDGGTLVLTAGIVTGIVTYCWGLLPAWGGFFVGAIPAFLIVALFCSAQDDK